jgi:hypothetical protein
MHVINEKLFLEIWKKCVGDRIPAEQHLEISRLYAVSIKKMYLYLEEDITCEKILIHKDFGKKSLNENSNTYAIKFINCSYNSSTSSHNIGLYAYNKFKFIKEEEDACN